MPSPTPLTVVDDVSYTRRSGRTLATTATMYRHENGRTYHAYRKSTSVPDCRCCIQLAQRSQLTCAHPRRRRVLAAQRRTAEQPRGHCVRADALPRSSCLLLTSPSHHLCIVTMRDRLFLAPIKDPKYILDVGRSAIVSLIASILSSLTNQIRHRDRHLGNVRSNNPIHFTGDPIDRPPGTWPTDSPVLT